MKNFITNHWKKIIIGIGIVGIIFTVFGKIFAKKTLLSDYVKYGPDTKGKGIIAEKMADVMEESTSLVSEGMVKMTIVFMVAILLVVFITSLGSKGSTDKAKKK